MNAPHVRSDWDREPGPEDLHRYSCVGRQLSKYTTTLAAKPLYRVDDSRLRQGAASEQID